MKKKKPSQTIERMRTVQVALFANAKNPEKRELLRYLEFQRDLREHIADVVRAVRSLNKIKGASE
ncbi:MAG TPA: hypothetical protein VM901_05015 [Bdellovibrionota bacterium]|jgi:hypothetical protein|nr:hypothetical protein [Bdellovibrionota bacterium]